MPKPDFHLPSRNALHSLLEQYALTSADRAGKAQTDLKEFYAKADELLISKDDFLQKVKMLDRLIEENTAFIPVKEYIFDLLLTNFLATQVHNLGEDYLESDEWQRIEDETLEYGTELLNLLLYINEAIANEVDMSLDDFLQEFLLSGEDEFQDEYRIYEDLIRQQELTEGEIGQLITHWKKDVRGNSDIEDLFIPLLVFFSDPEATGPDPYALGQLLKEKEIPALQPSLLQAIYAFKNSFYLSMDIHSN